MTAHNSFQIRRIKTMKYRSEMDLNIEDCNYNIKTNKEPLHQKNEMGIKYCEISDYLDSPNNCPYGGKSFTTIGTKSKYLCNFCKKEE